MLLRSCVTVLAAVPVFLVLGACASPERSQQVLEWVVSSEAEKARLEAEGFPQYVGGS